MSLYAETIDWLTNQSPNENEYLQAVEEVCEHIVPIVNANEVYKQNNVLQRILLPQKIFEFSVEWENDEGRCEINKGWRVQHSNALGPFKGGTRFHPSVNTSVLKFLAFEQCIKNALTNLTLGAGKGGANFDPKLHSNNEIRRFCRAYMRNLVTHIGNYTDVPAGDINVSDKEIGFMFGEYLHLTKRYDGVLSGKPLSLGGSQMRVQATGFGVIYFLENMLKEQQQSLAGKSVTISGAGNVALHTGLKAIEKGAKVLSLSNSRGSLVCGQGFTQDQINWLLSDGKLCRNALKELSQLSQNDNPQTSYVEGDDPWNIEADIAIPCATQNEIDAKTASRLIKNISFALIEGANMPLTKEASKLLINSKLLYAPGKAANSGGVILSGFEMQQNAAVRYESYESLDARLKEAMRSVHLTCVNESRALGNKRIEYMQGANVAGFRRVADAIVAQGY
jgi:glutamate dehydrogenase (NADP+)